MRAVVDTNVWISGLINPRGFPARVIAAVRAGSFIACMAPTTVTELDRVGRRRRLSERFGVRADDLDELLRLLRERALHLTDPPTVSVSRDLRDDIFIAVAVAAKADYLVTRDDDLKDDPNVRLYLAAAGIEPLSVARFLDRLEQPA